MAHLREQGLASLKDVRSATMEADGRISVIKTGSKASTSSRTTARWDGDGKDRPFLPTELLLKCPRASRN